MFSRTASRVALASASALIAVGALAVPAAAQGGPVGPRQYFYGQVFGPASGTAQGVIEVACAGAAAAGHPFPGQFVEVQQIFPPVTTTLGYTGNFGIRISADLIWSRGTIAVATPIATFTSYGVSMPIPTSITVPCSGSGVMNFAPSPDPDNSGIPSNVNVTFESPGV
jgi:hypothetical protein